MLFNKNYVTKVRNVASNEYTFEVLARSDLSNLDTVRFIWELTSKMLSFRNFFDNHHAAYLALLSFY